MSYCRSLVCAGVAGLLLAGCATADSDSPHVYAGMSRDHLRSHFGEPLRVEPARAGGEDWYYLFSSWSAPQVESGSWQDASSGRTDSLSISFSDSRTAQEFPVHISADGYVTDPIPPGKLVPR